MKSRFILTLGTGILMSVFGFAQSPDYGSGLKINLNQEGSKYVRFLFWNQIWAKSGKNNPGTIIGDEPASSSFDIGARRVRTIAYAQVSPRYLIVVHFGMNNQSFINGGAPGTNGTGGNGAGKKAQLFYHDIWNEYAIVPAKDPATGIANRNTLYMGAGLHYWNGVSRMTSASTNSTLMVDLPSFNWANLEMGDQIGRQFGVYAKGNMGKLHYRLNLNKPFATNAVPVEAGAAVDNNGNAQPSVGGYVEYQFLEQEAEVLPFKVGTYLAAKKVLNVGAGFYREKNGTRSKLNNVVHKHDIGVYAADVFADIPVGSKEKNMAVTAYSVFYNYNFGPRYIRTLGVMNPGIADPNFKEPRAQEGPGNSRFLLGTGSIWYTQAGLLLPKQLVRKVRIQPVASYTLKNLDALGESGHYYDVGTNFFIDAHHAKITLQYSDRPLYQQNKVFTRAGEWIVQFQVFL